MSDHVGHAQNGSVAQRREGQRTVQRRRDGPAAGDAAGTHGPRRDRRVPLHIAAQHRLFLGVRVLLVRTQVWVRRGSRDGDVGHRSDRRWPTLASHTRGQPQLYGLAQGQLFPRRRGAGGSCAADRNRVRPRHARHPPSVERGVTGGRTRRCRRRDDVDAHGQVRRGDRPHQDRHAWTRSLRGCPSTKWPSRQLRRWCGRARRRATSPS